MKRILALLAAVMFLVSVTPETASANRIVFQNNGILNPGGSLSFGNVIGSSTLTLSGGHIDAVGLLGGPSLDVTGTCGGSGCLDITSGVLAGIMDTGLFTIYTFRGDGSSMSITGDTSAGSGTLFSGSFLPGAGSLILIVNNLTGDASLQGVLGEGTIHPGLASFFGVPADILGGVHNSLFTGVEGGKGSVTSNDSQMVPIPEPGSMALLATGLFGLAAAARRRFSKK